MSCWNHDNNIDSNVDDIRSDALENISDRELCRLFRRLNCLICDRR